MSSRDATHDNLKHAFAREAAAKLRFHHFARVAEFEGHGELAALFREVADAQTGFADGHLDFLRAADPLDDSGTNLAAAIDEERAACASLSDAYTTTARAEGQHAIASWFESLARSKRSYLERLERAVTALIQAGRHD
jgi:rubrerythrin